MQAIGKEASVFALTFQTNYLEFVIQKQNDIISI